MNNELKRKLELFRELRRLQKTGAIQLNDKYNKDDYNRLVDTAGSFTVKELEYLAPSNLFDVEDILQYGSPMLYKNYKAKQSVGDCMYINDILLRVDGLENRANKLEVITDGLIYKQKESE